MIRAAVHSHRDGRAAARASCSMLLLTVCVLMGRHAVEAGSLYYCDQVAVTNPLMLTDMALPPGAEAVDDRYTAILFHATKCTFAAPVAIRYTRKYVMPVPPAGSGASLPVDQLLSTGRYIHIEGCTFSAGLTIEGVVVQVNESDRHASLLAASPSQRRPLVTLLTNTYGGSLTLRNISLTSSLQTASQLVSALTTVPGGDAAMPRVASLLADIGAAKRSAGEVTLRYSFDMLAMLAFLSGSWRTSVTPTPSMLWSAVLIKDQQMVNVNAPSSINGLLLEYPGAQVTIQGHVGLGWLIDDCQFHGLMAGVTVTRSVLFDFVRLTSSEWASGAQLVVHGNRIGGGFAAFRTTNPDYKPWALLSPQRMPYNSGRSVEITGCNLTDAWVQIRDNILCGQQSTIWFSGAGAQPSTGIDSSVIDVSRNFLPVGQLQFGVAPTRTDVTFEFGCPTAETSAIYALPSPFSVVWTDYSEGKCANHTQSALVPINIVVGTLSTVMLRLPVGDVSVSADGREAKRAGNPPSWCASWSNSDLRVTGDGSTLLTVVSSRIESSTVAVLGATNVYLTGLRLLPAVRPSSNIDSVHFATTQPGNSIVLRNLHPWPVSKGYVPVASAAGVNGVNVPQMPANDGLADGGSLGVFPCFATPAAAAAAYTAGVANTSTWSDDGRGHAPILSVIRQFATLSNLSAGGANDTTLAVVTIESPMTTFRVTDCSPQTIVFDVVVDIPIELRRVGGAVISNDEDGIRRIVTSLTVSNGQLSAWSARRLVLAGDLTWQWTTEAANATLLVQQCSLQSVAIQATAILVEAAIVVNSSSLGVPGQYSSTAAFALVEGGSSVASTTAGSVIIVNSSLYGLSLPAFALACPWPNNVGCVGPGATTVAIVSSNVTGGISTAGWYNAYNAARLRDQFRLVLAGVTRVNGAVQLALGSGSWVVIDPRVVWQEASVRVEGDPAGPSSLNPAVVLLSSWLVTPSCSLLNVVVVPLNMTDNVVATDVAKRQPNWLPATYSELPRLIVTQSTDGVNSANETVVRPDAIRLFVELTNIAISAPLTAELNQRMAAMMMAETNATAERVIGTVRAAQAWCAAQLAAKTLGDPSWGPWGGVLVDRVSVRSVTLSRCKGTLGFVAVTRCVVSLSGLTVADVSSPPLPLSVVAVNSSSTGDAAVVVVVRSHPFLWITRCRFGSVPGIDDEGFNQAAVWLANVAVNGSCHARARYCELRFTSNVFESVFPRGIAAVRTAGPPAPTAEWRDVLVTVQHNLFQNPWTAIFIAGAALPYGYCACAFPVNGDSRVRLYGNEFRSIGSVTVQLASPAASVDLGQEYFALPGSTDAAFGKLEVSSTNGQSALFVCQAALTSIFLTRVDVLSCTDLPDGEGRAGSEVLAFEDVPLGMQQPRLADEWAQADIPGRNRTTPRLDSKRRMLPYGSQTTVHIALTTVLPPNVPGYWSTAPKWWLSRTVYQVNAGSSYLFSVRLNRTLRIHDSVVATLSLDTVAGAQLLIEDVQVISLVLTRFSLADGGQLTLRQVNASFANGGVSVSASAFGTRATFCASRSFATQILVASTRFASGAVATLSDVVVAPRTGSDNIACRRCGDDYDYSVDDTRTGIEWDAGTSFAPGSQLELLNVVTLGGATTSLLIAAAFVNASCRVVNGTFTGGVAGISVAGAPSVGTLFYMESIVVLVTGWDSSTAPGIGFYFKGPRQSTLLWKGVAALGWQYDPKICSAIVRSPYTYESYYSTRPAPQWSRLWITSLPFSALPLPPIWAASPLPPGLGTEPNYHAWDDPFTAQVTVTTADRSALGAPLCSRSGYSPGSGFFVDAPATTFVSIEGPVRFVTSAEVHSVTLPDASILSLAFDSILNTGRVPLGTLPASTITATTMPQSGTDATQFVPTSTFPTSPEPTMTPAPPANIAAEFDPNIGPSTFPLATYTYSYVASKGLNLGSGATMVIANGLVRSITFHSLLIQHAAATLRILNCYARIINIANLTVGSGDDVRGLVQLINVSVRSTTHIRELLAGPSAAQSLVNDRSAAFLLVEQGAKGGFDALFSRVTAFVNETAPPSNMNEYYLAMRDNSDSLTVFAIGAVTGRVSFVTAVWQYCAVWRRVGPYVKSTPPPVTTLYIDPEEPSTPAPPPPPPVVIPDLHAGTWSMTTTNSYRGISRVVSDTRFVVLNDNTMFGIARTDPDAAAPTQPAPPRAPLCRRWVPQESLTDGATQPTHMTISIENATRSSVAWLTSASPIGDGTLLIHVVKKSPAEDPFFVVTDSAAPSTWTNQSSPSMAVIVKVVQPFPYATGSDHIDAAASGEAAPDHVTEGASRVTAMLAPLPPFPLEWTAPTGLACDQGVICAALSCAAYQWPRPILRSPTASLSHSSTPRTLSASVQVASTLPAELPSVTNVTHLRDEELPLNDTSVSATSLTAPSGEFTDDPMDGAPGGMPQSTNGTNTWRSPAVPNVTTAKPPAKNASSNQAVALAAALTATIGSPSGGILSSPAASAAVSLSALSPAAANQGARSQFFAALARCTDDGSGTTEVDDDELSRVQYPLYFHVGPEPGGAIRGAAISTTLLIVLVFGAQAGPWLIALMRRGRDTTEEAPEERSRSSMRAVASVASLSYFGPAAAAASVQWMTGRGGRNAGFIGALLCLACVFGMYGVAVFVVICRFPGSCRVTPKEPEDQDDDDDNPATNVETADTVRIDAADVNDNGTQRDAPASGGEDHPAEAAPQPPPKSTPKDAIAAYPEWDAVDRPGHDGFVRAWKPFFMMVKNPNALRYRSNFAVEVGASMALAMAQPAAPNLLSCRAAASVMLLTQAAYVVYLLKFRPLREKSDNLFVGAGTALQLLAAVSNAVALFAKSPLGIKITIGAMTAQVAVLYANLAYEIARLLQRVRKRFQTRKPPSVADADRSAGREEEMLQQPLLEVPREPRATATNDSTAPARATPSSQKSDSGSKSFPSAMNPLDEL